MPYASASLLPPAPRPAMPSVRPNAATWLCRVLAISPLVNHAAAGLLLAVPSRGTEWAVKVSRYGSTPPRLALPALSVVVAVLALPSAFPRDGVRVADLVHQSLRRRDGRTDGGRTVSAGKAG